MGQSSSRQRGLPQFSEQPSASCGSSTVAENPQGQVGDEQQNSSRKRRSFISRALRNVNSVRRSTIRRSKRWSKAPEESPAVTAESSTLCSKGKEPERDSSVAHDTPCEDTSYSTAADAGPSNIDRPMIVEVEPETTRTETEDNSFLSLTEQYAREAAPPDLANQPSLVDNDEVVVSPDQFSTDAPPEPASEPPPLPPSQLSQQQTRAFPPPGTLVIVQGVVHTTDNLRPNVNQTEPSTVAQNLNPSPNPESSNLTLSPFRRNDPSVSTPERASRNRLSALLNRSRPSSVISSSPRPPSFAGSTHSNVTAEQLPDSQPSAILMPPPSYVPDTVATSSSESDPPATPMTQQPAPSTSAPGSPVPSLLLPTAPSESRPAISSSSVDVLGTLLSVAAAATAASLLTGSTEHMLSSGLTPAGTVPTTDVLSNMTASPPPDAPVTLLSSDRQSPSSPSDSIATAPRPTSPTPTAGLGHLRPSLGTGLGSPFTPSIGRGLQMPAQPSRGERLRHAWSSIRERLGMRQGGGPGSGALAGNAPSFDGRERMLLEMARAFNMGLGLSATGPESQSDAATSVGGATVDSHDATNQPASPMHTEQLPGVLTLPPEGSFERFLVDLQSDLRVALLANGQENTSSRSHEPAEPRNEYQDESAVVSDLSVREDDEIDDEMAGLQNASDSESESMLDSDGELDLASSSRLPRASTSENAERSFVPDTPGTRSSSEPAASPSPSVRSEGEQSTEDNAGTRVGGRINWWRLYRFPPIVSPIHRAPHQQESGNANAETAASDSVTSGSSSSTTSPTSSYSISPTSNEAAPYMSASSPSERAPGPQLGSAPSRSNIVVPVIVVGLQSVNLNWRPEDPLATAAATAAAATAGGAHHRFSEDIHQPGHHHPDEDGLDLDAFGGGNEGSGNERTGRPDTPRPDTPRGRRWHARAANALRELNLRGTSRRRAADAQAPPLTPDIDGPGSRTFLIYVIGGYYPPDHNIVTSEPNNFDSFEALLDLAELLGQVKPPTVTREEIEKSGLEIVKASQLAQYERDGKISSNCSDRCLICLDDFDPEDNVRILTCKHGFHKDCVDKWLETGKNNCPACRTKGVLNDGAPPTGLIH